MSAYTDLLFLKRLSDETRKRQRQSNVLEVAVSVGLLILTVAITL